MATAIVILAAAFPAAGIAFASQKTQAAQGDSAGIDQRDREFLITIRFANLWEIPMGKLGTERGTTDAVKLAGKTMLNDHSLLNGAVEKLAEKYDVDLPKTPTSSQQGWMAEISSKQGKDFDRSFATRLRDAHGTVFSTVAEERSVTLNKEFRDFATQANNIVMKHMSLLEDTNYASIEHGMVAEAGARSADYPENRLGSSDLVLAAVIFLVGSVGTIVGVRVMSARGAAK